MTPPSRGFTGQASLAVVVVAYEETHALAQCLTALASLDDLVKEVILVDNSDSSTQVREFAATQEAVTYLAFRDNPGFGFSCNRGFERSDQPYILFLNPDCVVNRECIESCLSILRDRPDDMVIVGPGLYRADGTFDHAAKRGFPTATRAAHYLASRALRIRPGRWSGYLAPNLSETAVGEVDALNGAFMMMPSTLFAKLSGFDECFWMYAEDIDLCTRARGIGASVVYNGNARTMHIKHGTTGGSRTADQRLSRAFVESMALFVRKHPERYPAPALIAGLLRVGARLAR